MVVTQQVVAIEIEAHGQPNEKQGSHHANKAPIERPPDVEVTDIEAVGRHVAHARDERHGLAREPVDQAARDNGHRHKGQQQAIERQLEEVKGER